MRKAMASTATARVNAKKTLAGLQDLPGKGGFGWRPGHASGETGDPAA